VWWVGLDDWGRNGAIGPHGPYRHGAAGLPAVTRATNLIAGTLAMLPWRIVVGALQQPEDAPRWVTDPMLVRPDARLGPSATPAAVRLIRPVFWGSWIRSALLLGMGYLVFEEGGDGQPVAGTLRVLNPLSVRADVTQGFVARAVGEAGDADEVLTDRDGYFTLGARRYRMVELNNPLFSPDEYGITPGVLEMHSGVFSTAVAQQEYARGVYRSGVPAGFLKVAQPNFTAAQAEALKERWLSAHGGDRRSIAVLNSTTDFTPLSFSPVDAALVEMAKMSLLDIANAFGVPAFLLGGSTQGSLDYSNNESRSLDFRAYSLLSWATPVEETLSALLPAGTGVRIDMDRLLRADTASRVSAYSQMLASGIVTVDEVRRSEGLPPMRDDLTDTPEEGTL
jgi:HK97 family phage portal protein